MNITDVLNSAAGRDQIEHLGLDGGVERGRRLVEDQQRRLGGERHRDHDPLQHPARELVGIAPITLEGSEIWTLSSISRERSVLQICRARRSRRPRRPGGRPGSTGSAPGRAPGRPSTRCGRAADGAGLFIASTSRPSISIVPPLTDRSGPGSGRSPAPSSTCRSPTRRRGRRTPRGRRRNRRRAPPAAAGGAPGSRCRRARASASAVSGAGGSGVARELGASSASSADSIESAIMLTAITSEAIASASNSASTSSRW